MTILRASEAPAEDGGTEVTRPPQTTPEQSNRGDGRALVLSFHDEL